MRTLIMVIITLVIVAGFAAPLNAQVPNVELYFDEGLLFASANCPPDPPGTVADLAKGGMIP
ncbi:MAG: hypothetical protein KAT30_17780 [Candidatus Krumholzibacteria bacterium]|nr:hypothetical protein [Candidatus Krumholzibacteria bacterium]